MSHIQTLTTRRVQPLVILAVGLTLVYLLALVFDVSPWVRGPNDWRLALQMPQEPSRLWLPLSVMGALVALVLWADRRLATHPDGRAVWAALMVVALLTPTLQVSLLAVKYHDPFQELFDQTITPYDSGFFSVASQIGDLDAFLRDYPGVMRRMPEQISFRPRTHPPGAMVAMWLGGWAVDRIPSLASPIVNRLRLYRCEDPVLTEYDDRQFTRALAQMALPILSGLTVLPLFALGKRLWGSRIGFLAAACYPLIPAVNAWPAFWDALYPLAMCVALLSVEIGLERRRPIIFFVGGWVVSVASFFSFGNLLIAPVAVLYGLARTFLGRGASRSAWRPVMWGSAWLALGAVSIWLIYWLGWGVAGWDVYEMALRAHRQLIRPYWTYLLYNLYDFFVYVGIPVTVYFITQAIGSARALLAGRATQADAPCLIWVTTLVGLDVLGITRGEVGRLWSFLMPVVVLVGVYALVTWRAPIWLLAGLLAAQTLVISLVLLTAPADLRDPIFRAPSLDAPRVQHTTQARLGERFELLGYDLAPDAIGPGQSLDVTLYWKSIAPSQLQYTVFAHLLDSQGALRAQQDAMPQNGALPTSCWVVGEVVSDTLTLQLPAHLTPGAYTLQVGMYYLPTSERLPVRTNVAVSASDHVILQKVQVGSTGP